MKQNKKPVSYDPAYDYSINVDDFNPGIRLPDTRYHKLALGARQPIRAYKILMPEN